MSTLIDHSTISKHLEEWLQWAYRDSTSYFKAAVWSVNSSSFVFCMSLSLWCRIPNSADVFNQSSSAWLCLSGLVMQSHGGKGQEFTPAGCGTNHWWALGTCLSCSHDKRESQPAGSNSIAQYSIWAELHEEIDKDTKYLSTNTTEHCKLCEASNLIPWSNWLLRKVQVTIWSEIWFE